MIDREYIEFYCPVCKQKHILKIKEMDKEYDYNYSSRLKEIQCKCNSELKIYYDYECGELEIKTNMYVKEKFNYERL